MKTQNQRRILMMSIALLLGSVGCTNQSRQTPQGFLSGYDANQGVPYQDAQLQDLSKIGLDNSAVEEQSLPIEMTALDRLRRDLMPAIKTLPRDTHLYHYFGIITWRKIENTELAKADERTKFIEKRIQNFAEKFWDLNEHNTNLANAGLGLYLAVDPFASSPDAAEDTGANFGSVMIDMKVASGTKYLNVILKPKLQADTVAALISENKLTEQQASELLKNSEFTRDTLRYMVESEYVEFRKLVQDLVRQEEIRFIEYGWQAATTAFCGGRTQRSAMVYIGDKSDKSVLANVMVYWPGFDDKVQLTEQELEAKQRNEKLHSVLKPIRPLEKIFVQMQITKEERKAIYQDILNIINRTYVDNEELVNVKGSLLNCIK